MRKIYQKYFEVPEENKGIMGEHVFFARLAVSIVCIVLCMSAMGLSAYAFFTASVSSSMNQIQAASFDLEVQEIELLTGTSSAAHEGEKTYTLQPGIYDFVLVKSGNATTGYCQIVLTPNDVTSIETSEAVFYTQQFGKVEGQAEPVNTREITIDVGVATTVKFVPCWGTYSGQGFNEVADMIVVASGYTTNVNSRDSKSTSYAMVGTSESHIAGESTSTNIPETTGTANKTQDTNSTEAMAPMENKTPEETVTPTEPTTPTDSTNPVETTTPPETADSSESTVTPTDEKKEEASSSETEVDTAKSVELTEAVTTSTNTTE